MVLLQTVNEIREPAFEAVFSEIKEKETILSAAPVDIDLEVNDDGAWPSESA